MKLLLATSNPHKLAEIQAVMDSPEIRWITLADLPVKLAEPVEDQDTFEGNAAKKACHYAEETGYVTLADDSGLEVDALGGAPGVHSARYSGKEGPRSVVDRANNRKLLQEMRGKANRSARFVCVMAVWVPGEQKPWNTARGTIEGRILSLEELDPVAPEKGRGENGFGYDPLFQVEAVGCTTAQLAPEQKNRISHRGNAARDMWRHLRLLVKQSEQ
jgi:XTP/dITP diphosphohydrolase